MTPMDWSGKTVVVMGLGVNGGGAVSAEFCLERGADVLVTDLKEAARLSRSIERLTRFCLERGIPAERLGYRLGGHESGDFLKADFVIKNPGIPQNSDYLKGCRWTSDLALFLELHPEQMIFAVTGTKGKSSIAHSLHYLLSELEPESRLGGNIGCSPLAFSAQLTRPEIPVVLELSSWQLADLRAVSERLGKPLLRPAAACLSNIMRDHQNAYHSFSDYVSDKQYLYRHMPAEGRLFLPTGPDFMQYPGAEGWGDVCARDYSCRTARPNPIGFFSSRGLLPSWVSRGIYLDRRSQVWLRSGGREILLLRRRDFPLLSKTAFLNFAIAALMVSESPLVEEKDRFDYLERIPDLARSYRGVPHRMEYVGRKRLGSGRELHFYNDTTATMPAAAALALDSVFSAEPPNRDRAFFYCYLLLGGTDKDLDPGPLLDRLRTYRDVAEPFLLEGSGTEKLRAVLDREGLLYRGPYGSLEEAFQDALTAAESEFRFQRLCLLLSPGYASFGMFANEFERGKLFCELAGEVRS